MISPSRTKLFCCLICFFRARSAHQPLLFLSKLTQASGWICRAGRITNVQRALQMSQAQAFRSSCSVSALSSQVHSAQTHRFTVAMFSCCPSDLPTPALHLSPRTLVDPLLCYPSEVLQLGFVYIKMEECLLLAVTNLLEKKWCCTPTVA